MLSICFTLLNTVGAYLVVNQVHIAFADIESSMSVSWAINKEVDELYIRYMRKSEFPLEKFLHRSLANCESFRNDMTDSSSRLLRACFGYMHNLKHDSTYLYQIGSEAEGWTDTYYFNSRRSGDQSKVMVYGDFGGNIVLSTVSSIKSTLKKSYFDAIIHAGDIAYDLDSYEGRRGDKFLNNIQEFASAVPYMISQGNHEARLQNPHFKKRFKMPGTADGLWYSFNIGITHYLAFTTEMIFYAGQEFEDADAMLEFVKSDLQSVDRKKYPWLVVFTHRPFYCTSQDMEVGEPWLEESSLQFGTGHFNHVKDCTKHADVMKKIFEDLLYEYKVDFVITAHNHIYERILPTYKGDVKGCELMDKNLCVGAKAPIYVVAGAPGNNENYAYGSKKSYDFSACVSSYISYGSFEVFNETHARWEQIASDTLEVLDYLDLVKT